jgi:hypothetical protein
MYICVDGADVVLGAEEIKAFKNGCCWAWNNRVPPLGSTWVVPIIIVFTNPHVASLGLHIQLDGLYSCTL